MENYRKEFSSSCASYFYGSLDREQPFVALIILTLLIIPLWNIKSTLRFHDFVDETIFRARHTGLRSHLVYINAS